MNMTVTGTTNSRLVELRKYTPEGTLSQIYFTGGNVLNDGVDALISTESRIVYYIGGIQYADTINSSGETTSTTYSFTAEGMNNPNFITKFIYKDPNKENIISNPKINNDVFINRQEISAFEKNYRLEFVCSLVDLETYAGGNYFNIVKNG